MSRQNLILYLELLKIFTLGVMCSFFFLPPPHEKPSNLLILISSRANMFIEYSKILILRSSKGKETKDCMGKPGIEVCYKHRERFLTIENDVISGKMLNVGNVKSRFKCICFSLCFCTKLFTYFFHHEPPLPRLHAKMKEPE